MNKPILERESNIELLRIIATLMIIAHHVIVHVFFQQLRDGTYIDYYHNGLFNEPRFFMRLFIPELFSPLGKIGVNIFMIISGYFLIMKKQINIIKISIKLLLQLAFASISLVLISTICAFSIGPKRPFGSLITFTIFNDEWWFLGFYYIIVIAGIVFLNRYFSHCSRNCYRTMIVCLFLIVTLGFTGNMLSNLIPDIRTILAGVVMYLWGGYLRRFDPLRDVSIFRLLAVILVTIVFMMLSYYNAEMAKIGYYLRVKPAEDFIHTTDTNLYGSYSVVSLLLAISIFELFKRIKIKNNALINSMAQGTLTIYLLHDNSFVRTFLCSSFDLVTPLYYRPFHFCIIIMSMIIGLFIIGLLGFYLYNGLIKLLFKTLETRYET